ncbi:uncharacterized protein LOC104652877 [Saimiri boliviensis]|uniref:uncharacterized protein LOC104652877 n=1 Tax=Saimiri boliviensis TaxID=27679 RepID=UPI003D77CBE0
MRVAGTGSHPITSPGQRGGPCAVGGCAMCSSKGSCTEKGSIPIRSPRPRPSLAPPPHWPRPPRAPGCAATVSTGQFSFLGGCAQRPLLPRLRAPSAPPASLLSRQLGSRCVAAGLGASDRAIGVLRRWRSGRRSGTPSTGLSSARGPGGSALPPLLPGIFAQSPAPPSCPVSPSGGSQGMLGIQAFSQTQMVNGSLGHPWCQPLGHQQRSL